MTASLGSRFGVYDVRPSRLHSSERVHREYVVKSVSVTVVWMIHIRLLLLLYILINNSNIL